MGGPIFNQVCDCLDNPFGTVVPASYPSTCTVLPIEHFTAIVWRDVIIAHNGTHQA